ncbi:MAG TPA: CBS domain-containing protein [Aggregatilinea sp.]|uniref:CBS domain-containing protein n=1 Tax=Aggregatilinea sp. TaxID=2806333 RepID=UPI002B775607|nr:CBS domain-containing protein [Aggregatilinea sp.]HML21060.1 CBS domain-containing protein [Aggregatilinea sp.]
MKLILTHDNADFDAIASLWAAHRLTPDAVPVLPRRVNRNVERFLNLYSELFAFVQPDDLKRGQPVEHVTVVDTQGFSTVRGMHPDTPLLFIDHHPLTREMAPHQQFSGDILGATTTLLVEQLHARNIRLESVEATLLMLGIYEDTGSLLYGTTTPRDIRCAGWLLERGADLDAVRDFLQHPLVTEQRVLYEALIEHAEIHTVNGHAVVIACAKTHTPVDEIATLAHKLRELFDPGAVFVLVALDGDIQLVARGTTDDIDVSRIATHFGGGGHSRAAAALIRARELSGVREELLSLLPQIVTASVRVSALMSLGAQTIDAGERVENAASRMQRTGYEGFPVLERGKLAGLLTRRAVDRAMSHGMGRQAVRHIMEAGQITVRAEDSIEVLQQRMMRSGWGQIPVVDDRNKLIGIVTRTDLIKMWGRHPDDQRRTQIVKKLREALPGGLWTLVEVIAQQAQDRHVGLYVVGGFVRDLLLDQPNVDIDFVVEGDAIELVHSIQQAYGGDMRSHAQFGTAKWLPDEAVAAQLNVEYSSADWPASIDFVSARMEYYEEPTALPTVQRSSIKPDLYRRDFTINTLAIRLAPEPFGDLLDFYGGEQDLRDGVIRVLHSLSFIDDPTRMMRAVRLEQRLGFTIEARTAELIHGALPLLDRVSGDRIRHELALILAEAEPLRALARLERLDILAQIHPDLVIDEWVRASFYALRYAREHHLWPSLGAFDNWMLTAVALLVGRLSQPEVESLGQRLMFRRLYLDHVQDARTAIAHLPALSEPLPPSAVVALLEPLDEVGWLAAWAAAPTAQARRAIEQFAREWQFVRPSIDGRSLRALTGLKPGPAYGPLLRRLRAAWLDGDIDSAEDEQALLERLVADLPDEDPPTGTG